MKQLIPLALALAAGTTAAAPASYTIDPTHTYPSFEADHMGISTWRGKMKKSSGKLVYDKATGTGTVEITTELASIDFGQDQLNAWARGKDFFDVTKFPRAVYKGRLETPVDGVPTQVVGEFTLHGVTRPMSLKIHRLKCVPHPMLKRDYCGADATGTFDREAFGLAAGKEWGFKMEVDLRIQAEAIADK